MRLHVCSCVRLYVRMPVSVCPCVHGSIGQYIHTSIRLYVRVLECPYVCMSVLLQWRRIQVRDVEIEVSEVKSDVESE